MAVPAVEREPAATTRDRIVDAAETCIRRWGLRRVSMNDVARTAGVSRGSVYRYFADRDALVQAALERNEERLVAAALPVVRRRRTLAWRVTEAVCFIRRHADDELSLHLAGRPDEPELATLRLARTGAVLDRWIAFWVPFIEDARLAGEVRPDVDAHRAAEWIMRVIISLVTVPARTVDAGDERDLHDYVREHLVRGLRP